MRRYGRAVEMRRIRRATTALEIQTNVCGRELIRLATNMLLSAEKRLKHVHSFLFLHHQ